MAESKKESSSSVGPKEKKLLLDDEIGKEFLSSWKSMSVTENDTMDFSFDTISSGKKKAFNFGKLDMDFNLDGDFDKLSSFNIDMPELDFSCPSKKTAKSKDQSARESFSISNGEKDDRFTFSFDFNELDDFNLDSALTKGEKASSKKLDKNVLSADKSEYQVSKINMDVDGVADVLEEGQIKKISTLDSIVKSTVKTDVGGGEIHNAKLHNESSSSGNIVLLEERTPGKTVTANSEKNERQVPYSAKAMPGLPSAEVTSQIFPAQSLGGNDSTQDNVSGVQNEVGSLCTAVNSASDGEHNVNDETVAVVGSDCQNSELKNPALLHVSEFNSIRNRGETEKADSKTPIERRMDTEPVAHDLHLKATSISLSGTISHDCKENKDVKNSTLKLLSTLDSEQESGVVHSKYFRGSKETEPQLCQLSVTTGENSSVGSKGNFLKQSNSIGNGKSKDPNAKGGQTSRKLVDDSKSLSGSSRKDQPALKGSEKIVKNLYNIRDGLSENGDQSACELAVNSRITDNEVNKGALHMLRSIKNTKDLHIISPTDETTKPHIPTSDNSAVLISSMASKITPVEGLKGGKRIADLSSLKTLGTVRASKYLPISTLQKESNSSRKSEKSMEGTENRSSTIVRTVFKVERRMPVITSLKRKTPEAANADPVPLNPHKRFSPSPSESRKCSEPSKNIVEMQCNLVETNIKIAHNDHPSSGHEMSQKKSTKEMEICPPVENDGNVQKAEVYAKELEDICNMLKKKHEEAKEILVRAIVNNNSLLMLNHPIFDEKIRKVQRFAAQLVSK